MSSQSHQQVNLNRPLKTRQGGRDVVKTSQSVHGAEQAQRV